MGLGTFGGGVGVVEFMLAQGAMVTVTDRKTETELSNSIEKIRKSSPGSIQNCRFIFGEHRVEDFRDSDLIVVNPAVPKDNHYVDVAREHDVELTTEMNLFWSLNQGKTIGVTGSNGKSTTTALIHAILSEAGGNCWLGGNIGRSLLPVVDQIHADDWVVLELSSFQLEELDAIEASPNIAVVTNLTPNHLDRHGTMDEYRRCKQTILRWQSQDDVAVLNADDSDVANWPVCGQRLLFGESHVGDGIVCAADGSVELKVQGRIERLDLRSAMKIPGRHNFTNAMAATAVSAVAGATREEVFRGLSKFKGLPHRIEFIAEIEGRRFYNDSIATTPESTIAALNALDAPIVLLAGGYDKKVDLMPMVEAIRDKARAVALMGQTAQQLSTLINGTAPNVEQRVCDDFADSMNWACQQSNHGDVVLLSPGCASYGWFSSFVERGQRFVDAVNSLTSISAD